MEVKMTSLGAALIVFIALSSLTHVEATSYSLGSMITWVDPKVSSMLGVMWRYKDYGCNCGTGGYGRPLDKVDCCCQVHNECFERLVRDGTCSSDPFSTRYSFKKVKRDGRPSIQCTSPEGYCEQAVCQCDAAVVQCFAATGAHYSSHHKSFNQGSCDRANMKTDICEREREL